MIPCPSCGFENVAGAKFCSQCATALADAPVPARTERKVVTVLFADLVGFTTRAEQLDPEDVEAILRPYHERLRYELERWGGTVEKFIGDAVVALFGAPVARENDPERAVRAALAIRDWIAEEGKLEVRIAVNTGEALVNLAARPEAGEGMAAGDVVNTTARLQGAAPTNGILVGETTYRATSERIEYREHPAVEAKGKEEPVPVWEVVDARARFGVDLTPEARTPLVGRERELELLVGTLKRARQRRSPELVTLVGVPGIGKSRLVGELFQSIERGGKLTYWRQGRSLPYGEGVSYWALAEMVKAQAGILETDTDEDVEAKLTRAVEQLLEQDVHWVLSHLRRLVGQADEAVGSQEEAFAAWRRFLEALAEQHPLVLVFEDVQWADDGLLDFVEHLADWVHDAPMLILCTARRELLERRPTWGGGKVNASTVALSPLSDEETAELISVLTDRPLMEADLQTALLERAGGNPLYAEQYVRMLAERGSAEELPETVQGIIAARLDSLQSGEKALLQDAAVVGKVFWLGAVGASEQQLHALQQKEFVQRARRTSVEGEVEFVFKHALMRDVAYSQIPRAERADKHWRTAEWIESLGRPEDHAEAVAHHYRSALELTRAAGQSVEAIAPRARVALREAGDRAAALHALPQAERYYGDALELVPDDDPERPELLFRYGRIRFYRAEEGSEELAAARDGFLAAGNPERAAEAALILADFEWRKGRREGVQKHMEEARSLVAGLPPSRAQALVLTEASRYEMLADRNEQAMEAGREALRLAEELGLDDLRAALLNNIGSARGNAGDQGGIAELEESIELSARLNLIVELIRAKNNLAVQYLMYRGFGQADAELQEARDLAAHYGHHGFLRWLEAGPTLGNAYNVGKWDEVMAHVNPFLAEVEGGSAHYQAGGAYGFRALIRLARGEPEAVADAERALELARLGRDPQLLLPSLVHAAILFHVLGDERRAAEALDEALGELRELDQLGFAIVISAQLAWLGVLLGRERDVEAVLERQEIDAPWVHAGRAALARDLSRTADLLGEAGSRALEAFFRLRSAEQLVEEGRRAEADEQLQRALAFYRSVGATRFVREGEALLAASA